MCAIWSAASKLVLGLQDKDKNGYVDVDELTNLHSTTKERLTMLEAKKILEVGGMLDSHDRSLVIVCEWANTRSQKLDFFPRVFAVCLCAIVLLCQLPHLQLLLFTKRRLLFCGEGEGRRTRVITAPRMATEE